MEKACCEFKVFETEKGFKVVATGELSELTSTLGCCTGKSDEECCQDSSTIMKCDCCRISLHRTEGGLELLYEGDKSLVIKKLKELLLNCCN